LRMKISLVCKKLLISVCIKHWIFKSRVVIVPFALQGSVELLPYGMCFCMLSFCSLWITFKRGHIQGWSFG
jgi:hypothetical protein